MSTSIYLSIIALMIIQLVALVCVCVCVCLFHFLLVHIGSSVRKFCMCVCVWF